MISVLVDARIDAQVDIGRYTRSLIAALRACAPDDVKIDVLLPTGSPRYSRAEGAELVDAARLHSADVRAAPRS